MVMAMVTDTAMVTVMVISSLDELLNTKRIQNAKHRDVFDRLCVFCVEIFSVEGQNHAKSLRNYFHFLKIYILN